VIPSLAPSRFRNLENDQDQGTGHSSIYKQVSQKDPWDNVVRWNEKRGLIWKATKQESAEILLKSRRWSRIGHIIKKTQQQYHKKSRPMETTRTKKKSQAQEHMEKRSGAGDEGGTSHMGHNGDNSSRSRAMEAARWWPMLH